MLPKGVLNVITGHGEPAGSSLVTHPDIEMVSLTGSPETGKWIAKAAADSLKRVHLELGGKAPVIVFDDVDMSTGDGDDRRRPASTTPARTARPPRACWRRRRCTTTW